MKKIISIFSFLTLNLFALKKKKIWSKIILTTLYLKYLPYIYNILSKRNSETTWSWIVLFTIYIKMYLPNNKITKTNILLFVLGLFYADLNSGLVHIYLDNSKILNNNSLVDRFRQEFQLHHENPVAQFEIDPKYRAHYEMNMVFPYAILPFFFIKNLSNNLRFFIVSFCIGSVLQQTSHYWCHARIHDKPMPLIGKLMQGFTLKEIGNIKNNNIRKLLECSLVLNPIKHQRHHADPTNNMNFCILNGWANPLLNKINYKYKLATSKSFFVKNLDNILNKL